MVVVWGGGWLYGCLTEKSPPPMWLVAITGIRYTCCRAVSSVGGLCCSWRCWEWWGRSCTLSVSAALSSGPEAAVSASICPSRSRGPPAGHGSWSQRSTGQVRGQHQQVTIHRENTAMGEREGEGIEGGKKKRRNFYSNSADLQYWNDFIYYKSFIFRTQWPHTILIWDVTNLYNLCEQSGAM